MVPFIAIVLSVVIGSEIYISLKVRKRLMRLLLIMALHAAMFFVAILLQRYINPESPVYLLLLYSQILIPSSDGGAISILAYWLPVIATTSYIGIVKKPKMHYIAIIAGIALVVGLVSFVVIGIAVGAETD